MISVVVVNWNSGILLEKCVASLLRHAVGCEIIVVDNASEDHSADFVPKVRPALLLVRNAENAGFAVASNEGWRRSRGDCILFLNPDVQCLESAVDGLYLALGQAASRWAAAGMLLRPDDSGRAEASVRRLPTVASVAAEMLLLDEIWPGNPWTARYRMTRDDLSGDREVEQPAAACLMCRRAALEALGGFDEGFAPAWFEDVDLCKRILDSGGKILYHPSARFIHSGGYSMARLPFARFLEIYHSNQIRYFLKHHGAREAARVRRYIVAGMRLRAALSILLPVAKGCSRRGSFRAFSLAARRISKSGEDEA